MIPSSLRSIGRDFFPDFFEVAPTMTIRPNRSDMRLRRLPVQRQTRGRKETRPRLIHGRHGIVEGGPLRVQPPSSGAPLPFESLRRPTLQSIAIHSSSRSPVVFVSLVALGEAPQNRICTEVLIKSESERRVVFPVIEQNIGGETAPWCPLLDTDTGSPPFLHGGGLAARNSFTPGFPGNCKH